MSRTIRINGNGSGTFEFVIRNDVPAPVKGRRSVLTSILRRMKVDDSFEVPATINKMSAQNSVYQYNKTHKQMHFTFGKWPESNGQTYGCWRVK